MKRVHLALASLMMIISPSLAAESASATDMSNRLRQGLEEQFRDSTGLGFSRFECDLPEDGSQSREFACQAVDDEGDHFYYRIVFHENAEAPSVTTSQPVAQLNASGLAVLERPCLAFLDAFERGEWAEAYKELSAEFQTDFSLADLEAVLAPMRQAVGGVQSTEADIYTTPSAGLHGLEYTLKTDIGAAVARFRLRFDEADNPRIVAFLITAEPGSPLQASLLFESGKRALSGLFEQPVTRIEGPLTQLQRVGDSIEGRVWLDSGGEFAIRIEQSGTAHDLDPNDFRFQVLDVPWLFHRYLVSIGESPRQIHCPSRVAPDGDRMDCEVIFDNGTERSITVLRRGGEYRLVD